jgi:hypothetical protein
MRREPPVSRLIILIPCGDRHQHCRKGRRECHIRIAKTNSPSDASTAGSDLVTRNQRLEQALINIPARPPDA